MDLTVIVISRQNLLANIVLKTEKALFLGNKSRK